MAAGQFQELEPANAQAVPVAKHASPGLELDSRSRRRFAVRASWFDIPAGFGGPCPVEAEGQLAAAEGGVAEATSNEQSAATASAPPPAEHRPCRLPPPPAHLRQGASLLSCQPRPSHPPGPHGDAAPAPANPAKGVAEPRMGPEPQLSDSPTAVGPRSPSEAAAAEPAPVVLRQGAETAPTSAPLEAHSSAEAVSEIEAV